VVDAVNSPWESEEIPDLELLYMRIHHSLMAADGTPDPGAFRDHSGGMSTDWAKYASPEDTRQRARKPEENAVIVMVAGDVRSIPGHRVTHTPTLSNRAHTDVFGQKTTEARFHLRRLCRVILTLPQ
jgi:hypothetical protein